MSDLEFNERLWIQIKNVFRATIAFTFSHIGVCGLVVGYIICGAFLFQWIESKGDNLKTAEVKLWRSIAADRLLQIVSKYSTTSREDFLNSTNAEIQNYTMKIVAAIVDGYDGEGSNSTNSSAPNDGSVRWSFSGSFLYSLTVITTIGYGNVTPNTAWGKVLTIFYGILGMPLFLLYLSNVGDILARGFKWTFARCCTCRWTCIKDPETYNEYDEENMVTVPVSVCLALMVAYVWGGGLWFAKWEKWSILDASYFCFVSLSTIGFGDLVPGSSVNASHPKDAIQLSFIFCSVYLLLGMALIAMCFNLMQEEVIAKVRVCGRHLGCTS